MRTYAAWLFGLAAAFNGAVGLALMFGRDALGPSLGLAPTTGTNLVMVTLVAGFILIFAYGYLRIALDPVLFRPLIHLSAIGKLLAVAAISWPYVIGAIDSRLPRLAAGDLVFAVLFIDYLRRTRAATA